MTDFEKMTAELEGSVGHLTSDVASAERCVPSMLILGIIAPFVIALVLFFLSPSFVQKKDGTKYSRDNTKVFKWTILFSVFVWIALYLFTYCESYSTSSAFCIRK